MTKEITKAYILQQLQDKFKLRDLEPAKFVFEETVVPIYDIGQHLQKAQVKSQIKSITGGPTGFMFFTIPETERWHLHGYNVIFMTGTYTVAGLMVYRPVAANYFYIDLVAAQSTSYAVNLPKRLTLSSGEVLVLYVDGYTVTGDLELRVDVTVEEIR